MGVSRSCACTAVMAGLGVLLQTGAGPRAEAVQTAATGVIAGRVTTSPTPPAPPHKVTADDKICGLSVPNESLVVDESGGVSDAVVVVKGVGWPAPSDARVTNRACRFVPHVQVGQPGATLVITSEDDTLHTTHAYEPDNRSLFNVAIPLPGLTVKRPLERTAGAVRLACDTHPWMQGFIYVTPDRGVSTGPDGRFRIPDVPAGSYDLAVWHERLEAPAQRVTVAMGRTAEVTFSLSVTKPVAR